MALPNVLGCHRRFDPNGQGAGRIWAGQAVNADRTHGNIHEFVQFKVLEQGTALEGTGHNSPHLAIHAYLGQVGGMHENNLHTWY